MAVRPVFVIADEPPYYKTAETDFVYYSGFSLSQKTKCISSLHNAFREHCPDAKLLEISTKSPDETGRGLSAFSLSVSADGKIYPLESVFQGSKVFENGGPYRDIYDLQPWQAKKDMRLQESGQLVCFEYAGIRFPLEPTTFFYDWLYVNAVSDSAFAEDILDYNAFTDIEFNPKKSINCQARSAAIFVSLVKRGLLDKVLKDPEKFMDIVY